MSSSILKIAVVGGTTIAGVGIGVGAAAFSPSNTQTIKSEIVLPVENKVEKEVIKAPQTPAASVCIIYEVQKPVKESDANIVKKVLKKFENKDKFFEELETRIPSKAGNKDAVTKDINDACGNTGGKKSVNGNVYVWHETNGAETKWVYSTEVNKTDWIVREGMNIGF